MFKFLPGWWKLRLRLLMKEQVLQQTRERLMEHYQQVPQLSCGGHYDLDQQLRVSLVILLHVPMVMFRTDNRQL